MLNRRLPLLFACNLVPLFIGMGLFPVLPLYAAEFGATPTVVGIFYAILYVASAIGTLVISWLGPRVSPAAIFIGSGLVGAAALFGLSQVQVLWQVIALTAIPWFLGALTIPTVSVITGVLSDDATRGRAFSLMYLAYPIGALLGGGAIGPLLGWRGFRPMFMVLALVWAIMPLVGWLAARGLEVHQPQRAAGETQTKAAPLGATFYLLLIAFFVSAMAGSASRLGTSLSMQALDFSASAVASTATISGLVAIPVTLAVGVLSDRWGHKRVLMLGYLMAAGGAIMLLVAAQLWHFWVAASLLMIAFVANFSVASAFATSILPTESLGRALPRISSMDSFASIISFAGTGLVMDALGQTPLYIAATVLAIVATVGVSRLRVRAAEPEAVPVSELVAQGGGMHRCVQPSQTLTRP